MKKIWEYLRVAVWLAIISILGVILTDPQAIDWVELSLE